jgi:hypothetical protein
MPISVEHLPYISHVTDLEYPVQVVSDILLNNIYSPVEAESMRLKARGLANTAVRLAGWRRVTRQV